MSNSLLRAAEKRLAIALETFDRLEGEIALYTQQHAEAEARERELRQRRASLDELSAMTARRIAAGSLLDQAKTDLEPAREELHAAEIAANRERGIAEQITVIGEAIPVDMGLKEKLAALEAILSPALADILATQERAEELRGRQDAVSKTITPAATPDELRERGAQNPPAILGKVVTPEGRPFGHPLALEQPKITPLAWELVFNALGRIYGQRWREAQAKLEHERRERRARLAASSTEGYNPYLP